MRKYNKMEQIISEALSEKVINLNEENIGDDGVKYFCERDPSECKVEILCLCENSITAVGALHLSQVKWSGLTQLRLSRNQINHRGCQYISRASMNKLQLINLCVNNIENSGVSHLAKAQWKQLNLIYLNANKISFNAITSITKANWKHLNSIALDYNKLTTAECLRIILSETAIKKIWLVINHIEPYEEQKIRKVENKFREINIQI